MNHQFYEISNELFTVHVFINLQLVFFFLILQRVSPGESQSQSGSYGCKKRIYLMLLISFSPLWIEPEPYKSRYILCRLRNIMKEHNAEKDARDDAPVIKYQWCFPNILPPFSDVSLFQVFDYNIRRIIIRECLWRFCPTNPSSFWFYSKTHQVDFWDAEVSSAVLTTSLRKV